MQPKLRLPTVTLALMDSVCHELSRLALEECLKHVDFAEVLIMSDKKIPIPGAQWVNHKNETMDDVNWAIWHDLPSLIKTDHFLLIQWDSWVLHPEAWNDNYLSYDYIGAPWWYKDQYNVGNGGFSLRSAALTQKFARIGLQYQPPEDAALCRTYRPLLERHGFTWAPQEVAEKFSYENTIPTGPTFGYHGMWNWPDFLSKEQIEERLKLAPEYVRQSTQFQRFQDKVVKAA